jgi:hypothetical protein
MAFLGKILELFLNIDHLIAGSRSKIVRYETKSKLAEHLNTNIVYGTHSPIGEFRKDEVSLIKNLSENFPVYVVSNGKIDLRVIDSIAGWAERKNLGRDLGILRDSLNLWGENLASKNLVWINSSCVWDSDILMTYIKQFEKERMDLILMTDSWRGGYHFQSFFFFINRDFVKTFTEIYESVPIKNWRTKRMAVSKGEKKFSKKLTSDPAIKTRVVYSATKFSPLSYRYFNTYSDAHSELRILNAPFSKLLQ